MTLQSTGATAHLPGKKGLLATILSEPETFQAATRCILVSWESALRSPITPTTGNALPEEPWTAAYFWQIRLPAGTPSRMYCICLNLSTTPSFQSGILEKKGRTGGAERRFPQSACRNPPGSRRQTLIYASLQFWLSVCNFTMRA